MSGDRPATSFGDPNAQPPTPKQTPNSVVSQSPVFETPRNNQSSFEGFSGGTPRFAEEYSVFNNTPGSLRGSPGSGSFVDFSASTPYQSSTGQKRPLFAGDIAAQIATHVNHFSPNPNLPLPPVDPSRRLQSSPGPLATTFSQKDRTPSFGSEDRSLKKARQTLEEAHAQQALTPPPTAHKGARKLAPKLQMNTMQNEDGYPTGFVLGTPQQGGMPNFVTTPTDIFGYPLSAPATAPVFTDTRPFWDNDTSMNGMDYDFSAASAAMFQAQSHRAMTSLDWGRSNEMFQETGIIPQHQLPSQDGHLQTRRERPLAPKPTPSAPPLLESNNTGAMFGTPFAAPVDNTFNMMNQGGGVDPGLLFSGQSSSNLDPGTFNQMTQPPAPVQTISLPDPVPIAPKPPQLPEVRRVSSTREVSSKKLDRAAVSSPIKSTARPGLSRSFSENKGRKAAHRASLPALAPALRPVAQQSGSRPSSQSSRASGRTSPLKNHHRLSSLSSIPETMTPKMKTSVKFTIDSHGRARAETTTVVLSDEEDPTPKPVRSTKEARPESRSKSWNSSGEDESSEDDDPIIIPSRNNSFALPDPNKPPSKNRSFALPDPNKPTSTHPFHSSQRSVSAQSTSSLGIFYNEQSLTIGEADSDAETEVQESTGSRGDAASELRKVVQDRQKRASLTTPSHRYVSGPPRSSASTISPSSFTDASLFTPSSHGGSVRCVCRRMESPRNSDGFMIQCESCENWLHGKCANIRKDDIPSIYICAFCGDTPNAHGLRGRQNGRANKAPSRKAAASPLANKSFKSFR